VFDAIPTFASALGIRIPEKSPSIFRYYGTFTSGTIPWVFSQLVTSQICNFLNGNFPMYAFAVCPLAYSNLRAWPSCPS